MEKGIKQALEARKKAYVPYSKFKVGAAIELKDGTFVHGANVENISYGLTCCAERNALFSLISQGYDHNNIKAIYIVADTPGPISPCGACRQVMAELMPKDSDVILTNLKGKVEKTNLVKLLPYAFEEFEVDQD
ncbi:MAG: cytidine deaminase [Acholeplasmataceae bacterium]|nr:cytidine deaminase [Acholeplasmataceae bacterium]